VDAHGIYKLQQRSFEDIFWDIERHAMCRYYFVFPLPPVENNKDTNVYYSYNGSSDINSLSCIEKSITKIEGDIDYSSQKHIQWVVPLCQQRFHSYSMVYLIMLFTITLL